MNWHMVMKRAWHVRKCDGNLNAEVRFVTCSVDSDSTHEEIEKISTSANPETHKNLLFFALFFCHFSLLKIRNKPTDSSTLSGCKNTWNINMYLWDMVHKLGRFCLWKDFCCHFPCLRSDFCGFVYTNGSGRALSAIGLWAASSSWSELHVWALWRLRIYWI